MDVDFRLDCFFIICIKWGIGGGRSLSWGLVVSPLGGTGADMPILNAYQLGELGRRLNSLDRGFDPPIVCIFSIGGGD